MANNGPTFRVDDGAGNLLKLTAVEARAFIESHPGAKYAKNPKAPELDGGPFSASGRAALKAAGVPVPGHPSTDDVDGEARDIAEEAARLGGLVRVEDGRGNLIRLREGEVDGFLALNPGAKRADTRPAAARLGIDTRSADDDDDDDDDDRDSPRARLLRQSRPQLNSIARGLGIDAAGMANKIEVTDAILAAQAAGNPEDPSKPDGEDDGLEALDDGALDDLLSDNDLDADTREEAIRLLREKGVKAPGASQDGENGGNGQNGGNGGE